MGFYAEHILPRVIDRAMGKARFAAERPSCVGAARGRVLEIGFGSGHNLPHYSGEVEELLALEPNALARRLAAQRIAAAPFPVHLLSIEAERIPLDDASVDCATSTFTLCTVRDPRAALAEIRRVLRPGAPFLFLEHGRAPDPRVARWQDRLTPLQRRLGGGCHLNREIDVLLRDGGFELAELEHHYLRDAPRIVGYLYRGRAISGC